VGHDDSAEDLALLRDGLTRLLRDSGFDVVAAVEDAGALLRVIATEKPDVAIVDIRLPPTFRDEGVRAAVEARRRVPETAIPWSRSTSRRRTRRSCSPTATGASATC
jgi:DNA-binding NarL/FixJ family response regulator